MSLLSTPSLGCFLINAGPGFFSHLTDEGGAACGGEEAQVQAAYNIRLLCPSRCMDGKREEILQSSRCPLVNQPNVEVD